MPAFLLFGCIIDYFDDRPAYYPFSKRALGEHNDSIASNTKQITKQPAG